MILEKCTCSPIFMIEINTNVLISKIEDISHYLFAHNANCL